MVEETLSSVYSAKHVYVRLWIENDNEVIVKSGVEHFACWISIQDHITQVNIQVEDKISANIALHV